MSQAIQLRSRNTVTGDAQSEYDAATLETIYRNAAAIIDEDFVGPGHTTIPANGSPATGYLWVKRTQQTGGTPTVAAVANSGGGIVQIALDATSEKQEASLYANDSLNWDMTKYAGYESRAAASVLPTLVVEQVLGFQSAWIDGPDNASFYVRFQNTASGLNMQTKDGVQTLSAATGIVLVAGAFHMFRIDISDPTNVRFFLDGIETSTKGQFSFAATGASAILQPYASCYKASGVGVGSLQLDSVQLSMNRA